MSEGTRLGLSIMGAAVAMGVLGDLLLRARPWGLNATLWILALVAAAGGLALWRRVALRGEGRWLIGPALFFAAALAWRDSATLVALNLLGLLVALGLAVCRARAGRLLVAGLLDYARGLAAAFADAVAGSVLLLTRNIRWVEIPRDGWTGRAAAVGRGLLVALPLIALFGGLFAAADAAFAGIAYRLVGWDLRELFGHVVVTSFWAWLVGGALRRLLVAESAPPRGEQRRFALLGIVEASIVLGLLNALFLLFVLVQLRYLFGGAALVGASADLTYAEYARRGFFELVAVAALVLPLLLLADWAVRRERPAQERLFRGLVGSLVLLLFVVMGSAVQRMQLYQLEFGLTELRLYTTAYMGWLALVFGWFLLTLLRGRRERFAWGALVAAFAIVGTLDWLNPDALIVRTNTARHAAGAPFDRQYAASLSADAVPALIEALPSLPEAEQRLLADRVAARWSAPERPDWRTWSWGRSQAWQAASTIEVTPRASAVSER